MGIFENDVFAVGVALGDANVALGGALETGARRNLALDHARAICNII